MRENTKRREDLLDKVYELSRRGSDEGINKGHFTQLVESSLGAKSSSGKVKDYANLLWFVLDPEETGFVTREALRNIVELMGISCRT